MDAKLSIVNVRMLPVVVPLLFVTRVRSFITWPMGKGPRALPARVGGVGVGEVLVHAFHFPLGGCWYYFAISRSAVLSTLPVALRGSAGRTR